MTDQCVQEPLVRRAALEDRWTDALRQHVKTCPDCAAAANVSGFMSRLAGSIVRSRALPDPAVLWLKAHLLRGTAVADRVSRPLNVAQLISYVVIAAGWAALLTRKWTDLEAWLFSVTPANMLGNLAGSHASVPVSIVLAVVVLSSITVLLGLHAILAEE